MTRRFDRLTRSVDRMERDLEFSVEALALYIRAWLTTTPPLPDNAQAAAQAKGRERYESFIEALGRREPEKWFRAPHFNWISTRWRSCHNPVMFGWLNILARDTMVAEPPNRRLLW